MSTAELQTNFPSTRKIQTLIREKQEVELKVMTGDLLTGHVFWQDPQCICLVDQYDQSTIVWWHSVVYLKPKM